MIADLLLYWLLCLLLALPSPAIIGGGLAVLTVTFAAGFCVGRYA